MTEEWKRRLEQADDDYLTALSNRGIVKRAYKDRQECPAEVAEVGEEAVVKVGGETVTVRFPLGESRCTCPSRSICRHVVQAILALRESVVQPREGMEARCEGVVQPREGMEARCEGAVQPCEGMEARCESVVQPREGMEAPGRAAADADGGRAWDNAVVREACAYPLGVLKRALGSGGLRNLVNLAKAGMGPGIQYTSVITVKLPEQEFPDKRVVKLLSPLEHSSCTCHRKGLCAHKAAAVLWCRLAAGALDTDGLDAAETESYDMEEVKAAAGQMKAFLEELFGTGLSRVSPGVLDTLERLAIISHNAGLARFEGDFRALADSYDRYLKRNASFGTREVMGQLGRLYRRVETLLEAGDTGQAYGRAGEFKAEYLPVGDLDLIGVAVERFRSRTGYEGETIYFLGEKTGKWYTYTDARPTFYGQEQKREPGGKSPAPWGLGISFEELSEVRIRLTGAKCDDRGRLSSSRDTKGKITSRQGIGMEDIREWYYEDFGKLFRERMEKREQWLREASGEEARLVYVQPDSCARAEFSAARQRLEMYIYDKAGREIVMEVAYSKKESDTIRYLEKIPPGETPCFLGKVYLRDGRIRMYLVDIWENPASGL